MGASVGPPGVVGGTTSLSFEENQCYTSAYIGADRWMLGAMSTNFALSLAVVELDRGSLELEQVNNATGGGQIGDWQDAYGASSVSCPTRIHAVDSNLVVADIHDLFGAPSPVSLGLIEYDPDTGLFSEGELVDASVVDAVADEHGNILHYYTHTLVMSQTRVLHVAYYFRDLSVSDALWFQIKLYAVDRDTLTLEPIGSPYSERFESQTVPAELGYRSEWSEYAGTRLGGNPVRLSTSKALIFGTYGESNLEGLRVAKTRVVAVDTSGDTITSSAGSDFGMNADFEDGRGPDANRSAWAYRAISNPTPTLFLADPQVRTTPNWEYFSHLAVELDENGNLVGEPKRYRLPGASGHHETYNPHFRSAFSHDGVTVYLGQSDVNSTIDLGILGSTALASPATPTGPAFDSFAVEGLRGLPRRLMQPGNERVLQSLRRGTTGLFNLEQDAGDGSGTYVIAAPMVLWDEASPDSEAGRSMIAWAVTLSPDEVEEAQAAGWVVGAISMRP